MLQTSRVCSQKKERQFNQIIFLPSSLAAAFNFSNSGGFFVHFWFMTFFHQQKNRPKSKAFKWMSSFFVVGVIYEWRDQIQSTSGWWFPVFFMFTPIYGRFPFWLVFFRWVETTNQTCFLSRSVERMSKTVSPKGILLKGLSRCRSPILAVCSAITI